MTNGFYNLSELTTRKLKRFYKDAVLHAYDVHLEYCPSLTRERYFGSSIGEFIDKTCSKKTHNVCINRNIYYGSSLNENYGEIGFCTLYAKENEPEFLYIFTTIESLNKLVEKYKLNFINWGNNDRGGSIRQRNLFGWRIADAPIATCKGGE